MTAKSIPFSKTVASAQLDLMRGLAAIVVCIGHWRNLLYVDYPQIAHHRALFAVPYVLTGAGHQAVIIFFVLSGYLIGGSVFRMFVENAWSWKRYMTHRLVRLWLVLFPALVLGGLLDLAGINLHRAPALYGGNVANHVLTNVAQSLTLPAFAGNFLFLQGIFVATFGSNGPLWSLANEFWYYILFPLLVLLLRPASSTLTRILSAALALAIALMVGKNIMIAFPIWLIGAALASLPISHIAGRWRAVVATVYIPFFFFLAKTTLLRQSLSDLLLGCATFLLLWSILGRRNEAGNAIWVRMARGCARFSYTLYLVHVPFLVLVTSLTVHDTRWQPDAYTLGLGLAILGAAIGYSYLVAAGTEFRTDPVRRWVETRTIHKKHMIRASAD